MAAHAAADPHRVDEMVTGQVPTIAVRAIPRASVRRRRRLGLRARVTLGFAVVGVAVSGILAGGAFLAIRSFLIDQRTTTAVNQALVNARLATELLRSPDMAPDRLLDSLPALGGSQTLLEVDGEKFQRSVAVSVQDLPPSLRSTVERGGASHQRFAINGRPYLATGVALGLEARFYEVLPLSELDRTLRTIGLSLAVGAVLSGLLAAGLGWIASRRVLRPLGGVARAAQRIASGDLSARLDTDVDPDLGPLVGSFNHMADTLQDRINRDARFTSDVSHEMRSPLTSLRTAVQVMLSRLPPLEPKAAVAVDLVEAQVRRFERMVLDLLEISRLDAGVAPVDTEIVALGPCLQHIVDGLVETNVPVVVEPDAARARVAVDLRRLEWVVSNLLDNAEHHAGGATRVVVHRVGGLPAVSVDDAGPGIHPSERLRVFERFARGSTARHRAGSGLGLALVREHLRVMRGTVHISTSPDGGARFTICLPESES